ncbi:MAG: acyl-CoA-binding protein [Candidatus Nanopelagicales bacterium]|nr:acyl-CoA-binding protein [Candidatus Nanopelagicales bacterium]
MDIEAEFTSALDKVKSLATDPGNDIKLKLYALYKQATVGDVAGKKPGFTDFVGRAKHEAWSTLKGLTSEDAKSQYISIVSGL